MSASPIPLCWQSWSILEPISDPSQQCQHLHAEPTLHYRWGDYTFYAITFSFSEFLNHGAGHIGILGEMLGKDGVPVK